MAESSSARDEEKSPRQLSPQDRRIFEHWRRTLTTYPLFSPQESPDSPRKGYTLKDIPPPDLPKNIPTGIAPVNRIPPEARTKSQLSAEADVKLAERRHTGCISLVNRLFEKSPIIIFMNSELKKIGCSPPVYCAPCTMRVHGGFHPAMGIVICENRIPTTRRMETTLAHEMVHAFDHCRFKPDYNNLKHVACGEVLSPLCFAKLGSGSCVIEGMSIFR
jgi:Peptidase M76 family